MTKKEKRLQKIRQNPKNVRFEELRQILEDHNFELVRISGSHHHFRLELVNTSFIITVPYKKPHIKSNYVKDVIQIIDEIRELKDE